LALCNTDEHGNADAERGHDGGRRAPEHVGTAVRTRGKGLQHGEWRERRRVQVRTQSLIHWHFPNMRLVGYSLDKPNRGW